jgi:hypothetical protein
LPYLKLYTLKSGLSAHRTPTEVDELLTYGLADISDAIFMPPRIPHVMVPRFLLLNVLSIVAKRKRLFK